MLCGHIYTQTFLLHSKIPLPRLGFLLSVPLHGFTAYQSCKNCHLEINKTNFYLEV